MKALGLILALAVITEGLIEHYGFWIPSKWKPYGAALVAVILSVLFQADLFTLLGYPAIVPIAGFVVTGLLLARGSGYINALISRITNPLSTITLPPSLPGAIVAQGGTLELSTSPTSDATPVSAPLTLASIRGRLRDFLERLRRGALRGMGVRSPALAWTQEPKDAGTWGDPLARYGPAPFSAPTKRDDGTIPTSEEQYALRVFLEAKRDAERPDHDATKPRARIYAAPAST